MKTLKAFLFIVIFISSINAQEINPISQPSKWYLGLNFSLHTFNQDNNNHLAFLSLERKISKNFSLIVNGGFGSFSFKNLTNTYIINGSEGNSIETFQEKFNPQNRIFFDIAIKYSPFDWIVSPYLMVGYGTDYNFSSDGVTQRSIRSFDKNGALIMNDQKNFTQKLNSGFRNGFKYGIGFSAKLIDNYYLDGNVIYNGHDSPFGSIGLRLGF